MKSIKKSAYTQIILLSALLLLPTLISAKKVVKGKTYKYWAETMQFGTPTQKKAVLKQMRYHASKKTTEILLKSLKEELDEDIKLKIIQIFYEHKVPAALTPLLENLKKSKRTEFIRTAIDAIGRRKDKKATKHLLPFLTHEKVSIMQSTVRALGNIKADGVGPKLLTMLTNTRTDKELRYDLLNTLGKLAYKPAYKAIRKIAINRDRPTLMRCIAITALGSIKNKDILKDFYKIFKKEKHPRIKYRIIHAIGEIGAKDSVRYLQLAMSDPNEKVRAAAVEAAGKSKIKGLLPVLFYKLKYDKKPRVMVKAAQALQRLKADGYIKIIMKKFATSRDAYVLSSLLKIFKEEKVTKAAKILRKKQKEMKFSSLKDKIEKVLDEWGMKSTKKKKLKAKKANKKNAAKKRSTTKKKKTPPKKPAKRTFLK